MTAASAASGGNAATNAEVLIELRGISAQLGRLEVVTEETRRSTGEALQRLAVDEHRLNTLEEKAKEILLIFTLSLKAPFMNL